MLMSKLRQAGRAVVAVGSLPFAPLVDACALTWMIATKETDVEFKSATVACLETAVLNTIALPMIIPAGNEVMEEICRKDYAEKFGSDSAESD